MLDQQYLCSICFVMVKLAVILFYTCQDKKMRHNSVASSSAAFTITGEDNSMVYDGPIMTLKPGHLSPERGFFHLIKNALLAIHLLPSNCSYGMFSAY